MKQWIVAGACALALTGGGIASYAVVTDAQGGPEPAAAGRADDPGTERPVPTPAAPPAEDTTPRRVVERLEGVEVGMGYGEVLSIMGPADWEETQSTGYGDDVLLWYGAWGVYVSNEAVRSVAYYGGAHSG